MLDVRPPRSLALTMHPPASFLAPANPVTQDGIDSLYVFPSVNQ